MTGNIFHTKRCIKSRHRPTHIHSAWHQAVLDQNESDSIVRQMVEQLLPLERALAALSTDDKDDTPQKMVAVRDQMNKLVTAYVFLLSCVCMLRV